MAIDMNFDMGAVIKGFINKGGNGLSSSNSMSFVPYKTAAIILAVTVVLVSGYLAAVYFPMHQKNQAQKEELNKIIEMQSQLSVLDNQLSLLKKKLDKSKEQYLASLSHFGNSEDLGDLYQTVSTLASKYNLVVLNVKEIAEKPAPKQINPKTPDLKGEKPKAVVAPAPKSAKVDVKEIKVEVELKGRYAEYIKFKEDLAIADILLKVNAESIMVKDDKTDPGSIYAKLNLSTYAIDKKPFEGIVKEDNPENTDSGAATDTKTDGKQDDKANAKTN